jgi:hypothetical protein
MTRMHHKGPLAESPIAKSQVTDQAVGSRFGLAGVMHLAVVSLGVVVLVSILPNMGGFF